jgi:hypothetical protein
MKPNTFKKGDKVKSGHIQMGKQCADKHTHQSFRYHYETKIDGNIVRITSPEFSEYADPIDKERIKHSWLCCISKTNVPTPTGKSLKKIFADIRA